MERKIKWNCMEQSVNQCWLWDGECPICFLLFSPTLGGNWRWTPNLATRSVSSNPIPTNHLYWTWARSMKCKKKSQKETELLPWKHNVIYTEFQGPSNLIQSAFRNKKNQWMNKIDTFDQICTDKVLVRYNDIIIRNSSSIFTCPSFNWRFSEPAQSIIHDKNSNMKWNSNGNIRRSMIIEDF